MKVLATIATSLLTVVAVVVANPIGSSDMSGLDRRQTTVCSGTYSNAQCCATDVLNLVDLDCANPPSTPTSNEDFIEICAAEGQQAKCCLLPVLGQDLLCNDVTA